jgi:hypothetical protein
VDGWESATALAPLLGKLHRAAKVAAASRGDAEMIPRFIGKMLPSDEKTRAAIFAVVSFFAGTLFSPFCAFTITGTLVSIQERATFPMIEQRIEVTRRAISAIPCDQRILAFAPLVNEAIQWNLRIAHEKQANQLWYSDYFSTDEWNRLTSIPLPCENSND